MKWKSRVKKCIVIFCLGVILSGVGISVVHATEIRDEDLIAEDLTNEVDDANENRFSEGSPWLDNADESIYSNSVDAAEEEQEIEPDDPGSVEKYLSELVRNAASSLISLLEENLNAGLDQIIYGRVGSGKANSVNIYGFELRSGNPYGVTASVSYTLFRSMVFVFLGISFVFLLAKSAWMGRTAQSREQLKSEFYLTAMKFSVLTLMPYLFDLCLYIRDVMLYGVKEVTGQMITGGATLSLSNAFLINAERTDRFIDALMYLGTVLLTLYFAFIYIAIAIDLLICFVAFPIMCVLHTKKRDLFQNWTMNVLSDIITPILDAILLLVPLLTSLMLSDVIKGIAIIQLIMCMLIIPSRNRIKVLLGIQNNERNGILGAMGLMTLGRVAAGKIKGVFGKMSEMRSDVQKSLMHGELAGADEAERESLLGGFSANENRSELSETDMTGPQTEASGAHGISDYEDDSELQSGGGQREQNDLLDEVNGDTNENLTDDMHAREIDADSQDRNMTSIDSPEGDISGVNRQESMRSLQEGSEISASDAGKDGIEDDGTEATESSFQASPLTRNEAVRSLNQAMEQKQMSIDGLKAQKAQYLNQEKKLARQMLNHERGTEEYRQLEKKRADAAVGAAETEQRIAGQMQDVNLLKNQVKAIRGSQSGPEASAFDDAKSEIICKRANINNFEQPEFRNALSNAQMQKLYRNRAIATGVKGVAAVAGAAAGTVLLGGGSIFMQPSTVAMATAGGAVAGASVGGFVESGVVSAGIAASHAVREGAKGYHAYRWMQAAKAGTATDFDTAYAQAPMSQTSAYAPSAIETPLQRERRTVREEETIILASAGGSQMPSSEVQSQDIIHQRMIEQDSSEAMKKVMSSSGSLRTSAALVALEKANVETEKYLATVRETQGLNLTQKQIREKRIELQTEFMTEEVLVKLSQQSDYEKGSDKYNSARALIEEKVRAIVEKKNRDIL
ncbi:MAG: hypothetical protein PHW34_09185 [Hespellia sp.]|nr:hypothetical protein [Hespellia sp.]